MFISGGSGPPPSDFLIFSFFFLMSFRTTMECGAESSMKFSIPIKRSSQRWPTTLETFSEAKNGCEALPGKYTGNSSTSDPDSTRLPRLRCGMALACRASDRCSSLLQRDGRRTKLFILTTTKSSRLPFRHLARLKLHISPRETVDELGSVAIKCWSLENEWFSHTKYIFSEKRKKKKKKLNS